MSPVSEVVKNKTTKCAHNFSCLSTGLCCNPSKCKVLGDYDKNMLFVEPLEPIDPSCPYHMTHSSSGHMCTCPTHFAIYMKRKRLDSYTR
jgi:hypothetical protein